MSQAAAQQRRGRAGRVQPGVCFRMFSGRTWAGLPRNTLPEMLRSPLESVCLTIKGMQIEQQAGDGSPQQSASLALLLSVVYSRGLWFPFDGWLIAITASSAAFCRRYSADIQLSYCLDLLSQFFSSLRRLSYLLLRCSISCLRSQAWRPCCSAACRCRSSSPSPRSSACCTIRTPVVL